MKKVIVFILVLQAGLVFSQDKNRFDISLGANYPINFAEEKLARELGFELGINYDRLFKYNIFMETSIQATIFQTRSWRDYLSIQVYLPFALGYRFERFEVSAGIFITKEIWTNTNINYSDPEVSRITNTEGYYYDLSYLYGRLFNYKFNVSYLFTEKFSLFWDSKLFRFSKFSSDVDSDNNIFYRYSLNTIGLRYRL